MTHDCFFSLFLISHHAGKLFFSITRMITRITILIARKMFSSCHERGTKKKTLSPHEESTLRPSDSALRCSTIELQRLHGEEGMVSFELGKEIEKGVFSSGHILSISSVVAVSGVQNLN